MRYVLIDAENCVVNTIVVADGSTWSPPVGLALMASEAGGIGDVHDPITGGFAPTEPTAPVLSRWKVDKRVIVDRLHAAGKLEAADAAIAASPLLVRKRWETSVYVWSDAPEALALLAAIGADPAAILASSQ